MKFLYPQFLWAFTILILPIVIHLFNFKRYKTLYFSSLKFVKQVDQQTKSTQRLKHLLILASRLLAFIFLVLAFAQPYFTDDNESTVSTDPILAIYIDNSFSMQAKGAEGELLSQARENAQSMIEKSALDTRFLICTNELSGREERLMSRVEALEKIDEVDYSPISKSISSILNWQLEVLKKEEFEISSSNTQVVLLSDFQRSSGKIDKVEHLKNFALYPVIMTPQSTNNIHVDSVWFSSPIHKINTSNEINIRIVNQGEIAIENAEVTMRLGDLNKTFYTSIPASGSSISALNFSDRSTGVKKGQIQVNDEMLLFDNSFFLSYDVREQLNVLILNGEDATPNIGIVYNLDPFYKTTETSLAQLTREDFFGKDLVIVNGANTLSKGVSNYLIEFESTGGSLALFPGTKPENAQWNELLRKLNHKLLGQKINSGNRIQQLNYEDEFFKGVFKEESNQLNMPSVSTSFNNIHQGKNLSQPLLLLQNGQSLLSTVRKEGRTFMFFSSLDKAFGNFQNNALFSTILLRIGELSQKAQPNYILIGESTLYPVYNAKNIEQPIRIKKDEIEFIPQSTEVAGVKYLSLSMINESNALRSGNYTIQQEGNLGTISLNYDSKESNLDAYSEDELQSALSQYGKNTITFHQIGRGSDLSTIVLNKPFSYWKICIVLTIIFVLIEMALIRFLK